MFNLTQEILNKWEKEELEEINEKILKASLNLRKNSLLHDDWSFLEI